MKAEPRETKSITFGGDLDLIINHIYVQLLFRKFGSTSWIDWRLLTLEHRTELFAVQIMAVHRGLILPIGIVVTVYGSESVEIAVSAVPILGKLIQISYQVGFRSFKLRILHLFHQLLIYLIVFNCRDGRHSWNHRACLTHLWKCIRLLESQESSRLHWFLWTLLCQ